MRHPLCTLAGVGLVLIACERPPPEPSVVPPQECSLVAPHAPKDPAYSACLSFETCVVGEAGHARCVELADQRGKGEPCAYEDECAPGLVCVESLGCRPWCLIEASHCDDGPCVVAEGAPRQGGHTLGFCGQR